MFIMRWDLILCKNHNLKKKNRNNIWLSFLPKLLQVSVIQGQTLGVGIAV